MCIWLGVSFFTIDVKTYQEANSGRCIFWNYYHVLLSFIDYNWSNSLKTIFLTIKLHNAWNSVSWIIFLFFKETHTLSHMVVHETTWKNWRLTALLTNDSDSVFLQGLIIIVDNSSSLLKVPVSIKDSSKLMPRLVESTLCDSCLPGRKHNTFDMVSC